MTSKELSRVERLEANIEMIDAMLSMERDKRRRDCLNNAMIEYQFEYKFFTKRYYILEHRNV